MHSQEKNFKIKLFIQVYHLFDLYNKSNYVAKVVNDVLIKINFMFTFVLNLS